MDKLEEIFRIEDDQERQKALVEYARTLKVNVLKAKSADGGYNEDELAVLIYNAQASRKTSQLQNVGFIGVALFLAIIVIGAINFFMKLMTEL